MQKLHTGVVMYLAVGVRQLVRRGRGQLLSRFAIEVSVEEVTNKRLEVVSDEENETGIVKEFL